MSRKKILGSGEQSLVVRLLQEQDKEAGLTEALNHAKAGRDDLRIFRFDPFKCGAIPNTPFCYWVGARIRNLFTELEPLETGTRTAAVGLQTSNNDRFVRTHWEVDWNHAEGHRWFPYAKGGSYRPFYRDLPWVVKWEDRGREIAAFVNARYEYLKGNAHRMLHVNEDHYPKPALTWVRRTKGLCVRALPLGGIFSQRAQAIIAPVSELLPIMGLLNSSVADRLLKLSVGRTGSGVEFEKGMLSNLPWPQMPPDAAEQLGALARRGWRVQRKLDTATQTSQAFVLPALLHAERDTLAARRERCASRVAEAEAELDEVQAEINELAFGLYGLEPEDRTALSEGAAVPSDDGEGIEDEEPEPDETRADEAALASALLSWLVGAAFGRFDVRLATGEVRAPDPPDPFDRLPVCAPGILVGPNGLPATATSIASTSFLNARRDAATYPDPDHHADPRMTAADYPLRVAWDGILVEDPGFDGESPPDADIVRRVREVMEVIWGEAARDIEEEMARMLGVSSLRDYTTRHTQLFHDDLRRYTRTRKAPIYWSLSTESGGYTIWLYYPRLSQDTLYRAVSEHVEPKITSVDRRVARLSNELEQAGGRDAARISSERSDLEALRSELQDFREELLGVAELPYRPNLDDGVEINAAPLWRLFPHRQWQKRMKKTWKKLQSGEYDWSHMARVLWPDRVREACRQDQSIAIAHDLEDLYEGET